MDWLAVLKRVTPQGKPAILEGLAAAMPNVVNVAQLTTLRRQACFLGQCAEESDGFKTTTEYASGKAYEGRRDLGNTQPGDGVRYKGRGIIELTGRANYLRYGKEMGVDLVGKPELAAEFPAAVLVAALYWHDHALNPLADKNDIAGITRKVNGGENGLAVRRQYTSRATMALAALDAKTPSQQPPASTVPPPAQPSLPHPKAPANDNIPQPQGFWARLFRMLATNQQKAA